MTDLFHIEDAQFTFADGFQIFKSINFTVQPGDLVKIEGESGSGKSTILKLLARFLTADQGTLEYKGKSIYDYPMTDYRKEVSYFFQNAVLFDETVRDNLSFPAQIRHETFDEEKAISWLERVGLSADYMDRDLDDLSGGEKQRIGFIRNLQYMPKVLLMDEVTSSLDKENRQHIAQIIKYLVENEDVTVISISHFSENYLPFNMHLEIVDGKVREK